MHFVFLYRHIENDISRIEEITSTPWISKSIKMFDMYMADFFNALQLGAVNIKLTFAFQ